MKTFEDAQIGDKVTDIIRGEGTIIAINSKSDYPIIAKINRISNSYTIYGKFQKIDEAPSLYYGVPIITGNKTREEACPIDWEKVEQDTKIIINNDIHYFAAYIKKSDKVLYFGYGNKSNAFDDIYFIDSEKVKLYHE